MILLRDPELAGEWPANDVPYQIFSANRTWDPAANRYVEGNVEGSFPVQGAWFRFSPEFVGVSHPREPAPQGVRAWSYEMVGQFDPFNAILNGRGFDNITRYTDSPELNRWTFVGDDRVEVFIPSLAWTDLEFLDPEGECLAGDWCDVGTVMRRYLGSYEFRVRGRSTAGSELFEQATPEVVPGTGIREEINLTSFGRRTEIVERTFSIRLGIADESGALATIWPAP
jgi:hypothetical protein